MADPRQPTEPLPTGAWTHPTGERLDDRWIDFARPSDAPATAGEAAAASLARPPIAEPESPERDYPSFIDLDDPIYGLDEDDDKDDVGFGFG